MRTIVLLGASLIIGQICTSIAMEDTAYTQLDTQQKSVFPAHTQASHAPESAQTTNPMLLVELHNVVCTTAVSRLHAFFSFFTNDKETSTPAALAPCASTIRLLRACKQSGTSIHLCADCTSEEWRAIQAKHPDLFGPDGLFDATHTHHADCTQCIQDPAFYQHLKTLEQASRILFIGNSASACAAATHAHIASVTYNCAMDPDGRSLHKFLIEQNAMSVNTLPS